MSRRMPPLRFPRTARRASALVVVAALLVGCSREEEVPVVETVQLSAVAMSTAATGELKARKTTPLRVPGENWAQRRLVWMLPEGSPVKAGDIVARFSAEQGRLTLEQAMIDLQRNELARTAKQGELGAGQARIGVDLAKVHTDLAIAERFAHADMALARNQVLDAVQDRELLATRQETLEWKRGQSGARGAAELAVLSAQRATHAASLHDSEADLKALELRAPHDGLFVLSTDWSGEKPAIGASMYAGLDFGGLPDSSTIEVELVLPQQEVEGIQVGSRVELHPIGRPEQAITTRIAWMAGAAKLMQRDSPVKYLAMTAPIPADAVRRFGLVPGQQMQARVVVLPATKVLTVANLAVQEVAGRSYVHVREDGRFVRRAVKLGKQGVSRSQVLAGLSAGDEVNLAPPAQGQGAAETATTTTRGGQRTVVDADAAQKEDGA